MDGESYRLSDRKVAYCTGYILVQQEGVNYIFPYEHQRILPKDQPNG